MRDTIYFHVLIGVGMGIWDGSIIKKTMARILVSSCHAAHNLKGKDKRTYLIGPARYMSLFKLLDGFLFKYLEIGLAVNCDHLRELHIHVSRCDLPNTRPLLVERFEIHIPQPNFFLSGEGTR